LMRNPGPLCTFADLGGGAFIIVSIYAMQFPEAYSVPPMLSIIIGDR
jgi:hypothetical protein